MLDCHPEGLRAAGWQQGCLLRQTIPLTRVRWVEGRAVEHTVDHEEWAIVAQDCDLAWNSVAGSDSLVELRPVYRADPPDSWGIRSDKFRLSYDGAYLIDHQATVKVEPDVVRNAEHACAYEHEPARRLKTWLGLRYDRPAVLQEYIDLANDLAQRLRKKSHRQVEGKVRDILVTFTTAPDGAVEFALVAVVPRHRADLDAGLLDTTRAWLTTVALSVPPRLGLSADVEARTDEQVSLGYLESSYSLDVSTVSWPNTQPGPTGDVSR